MQKGPKFLKFCIPIIEILRELGNSGTPSEVTDLAIEKLNISEEEQSIPLQNGESKVRNQIAWGRFYLAKAGLLDSSVRGVWSLTDAGKEAKPTDVDVYKMFKEVQAQFKVKKEGPEEAIDDQDVDIIEGMPYKENLLNILKTLSPGGFERICQRLLRESGFKQVVITGRSGDGGIDGNGILQINPLVSFRVLFQCKRYQNSVGPSEIRDFRGAMQGRADKGIFLTTGSFTSEARKEAQRDGVPPIEIVDGEKLVEMFETLELGLKPKKSFDVDLNFFTEFK